MESILGGGYGGPQTNYPEAKLARMPTMKQRIDMAVQQAEERLAAAKEAQEIFNRNPDLEKLINAMQRGNF